MSTILTGLRANGDFHLGNELGSMIPMVRLQQKLNIDDRFQMFVADLHSFTTSIDHSQLHEQIIQNVRMYMAAGIDTEREHTLIYRQSHVPQHAELAWVLSCFTGFGELGRMVEFKDKTNRIGNASVSAGLFTYPVLMAADILLYDADYIPLGDDQKQHMELTRTLANRMNTTFKSDLFTVPKSWKQQLAYTRREQSVRIRSLQNPSSKMSKSISDPKGTISLLDPIDEVRKKIMSAETDSAGSVRLDWDNQPGISNLLQILAAIEDRQLVAVAQEWSGVKKYGDLKQAVADSVCSHLEDFRTVYDSISQKQVMDVLERGETQARDIAQKKLQRVYELLGLSR